MSENLNRSTPDFSKHDSMSIEELEEILRADATGPERDDSDVDEILYVMEVLAKKRRQNGIAGKTALEAYQEFQQHYMPMAEEEDVKSVPSRRARIIPFRRIAAIAASLVLVFTLTTSANAFSFKDIWNAIIIWAEETFTFTTSETIDQPEPNDSNEYFSMQDALEANGRDSSIVPVCVPDGYVLSDFIIDKNPLHETYMAVYTKDESRLTISVRSFLSIRPEYFEVSNNDVEIYTASGVDYYISSNHEAVRAAWLIDSYECNIYGELTIEELKIMIDSITKG